MDQIAGVLGPSYPPYASYGIMHLFLEAWWHCLNMWDRSIFISDRTENPIALYLEANGGQVSDRASRLSME